MKKNNRKNTPQKLISSIITVVCLAVFIYASHGLIEALLQYYKNRQIVNEVQEIFYQESEHTVHARKNDSSTDRKVRSGFDELLKINKDVIGWVAIEDTKIDYPVMQTENNTDYLRTSFYGDYLLAGSLFLDYRNDIKSEDERNFIIYGHRVKDGSMFEHLTKYLDEDFYQSHRIFTFDTLYDEYEAEVFAVYNTMIDFNYIQTDFDNEEDYEHLLSEIKKRSIYDVDIDVSAKDQILTLSTCEYTLHPDDSRLVVHAKLTKK